MGLVVDLGEHPLDIRPEIGDHRFDARLTLKTCGGLGLGFGLQRSFLNRCLSEHLNGTRHVADLVAALRLVKLQVGLPAR